jgi:hypothetical protein
MFNHDDAFQGLLECPASIDRKARMDEGYTDHDGGEDAAIIPTMEGGQYIVT